MQRLAEATLSILAPALKWLELARTIISRITQFIDRIPAPIREFLKYVMGYGIKKFSSIASRMVIWIGQRTLSRIEALGQQMVIDDGTINTIIFTASSAYGAASGALAMIDKLAGLIQTAMGALEAIKDGGVKIATGMYTLAKFAYRMFGGGGGAPAPTGSEAESATSTPVQSQAPVPVAPPQHEFDLKFLHLLVTSPTVQAWEERAKDGSVTNKGGIVLESQLQLLLGSIDHRANVNVKVDYSGNFDFNLEGKTPLFGDGVGYDGLFNMKGLLLSKLGMRSGIGLHTLEIDLQRISFGDDVLVGNDLNVTYHATDEETLKLSAPSIQMNAFGQSLSGSLGLGFADTGKLKSGQFMLRDDKTISLFGDHLQLRDLTAAGAWANGKFKSISGTADLLLNVPKAELDAEKFKILYKGDQGMSAEAASLGLTLDVLGATVSVEMLNPHVDKDGFAADKVTFEFTKPKPDAEGQAGNASEVKGQADFLKSAVPGFDLSWITQALDVEHFNMQVSNARIGQKAKPRSEEADSSGGQQASQPQPVAETPVAQTPTVQASGGAATPVLATPSTPAKETNAFRLNALKASAFGFGVDGKFKEATNKFEGTIQSKHFDLAPGEAPATFAVGKTAAGDQFEADIQNLKWNNVSPFGLFKAGSINVTELKLVSGLGIQTLGLTIQNLDFGNGTLKVGELTGTLKGGVLEITGSAIQFSLFGQAMTGAFRIQVDRSGKPKEIKATLDADTDIDAISGMLKLKKVGGALDWKDGKLSDAGIHGDIDLSLVDGAITASSSGLKFGYKDGEGMFAEADELGMQVNITETLQLLLRLEKGRVGKGGSGLEFKAEKVAASLSYGKKLFSGGSGNIGTDKMGELLPNIPANVLNFAGVEAVGFTLSAKDIVVNKKGLVVTKWDKVLDTFKGKIAGLEFGYDKEGAQLESQADSARRVEQPVSQDPARTQPQVSAPDSSQASSDPSRQDRAVSSDPSTPVAQKGPGAWAKGKWAKDWSIPALDMSVPILPGINVGGSLAVGAGISASVGAAMTKVGTEGKKDRYQMEGLAAVSAEGFVKAGLHASIGSEFIFAIQAGFFAEARIRAAAEGRASGIVVWDNDTNRPALSDKPADRPKIEVNLSTKLLASVGAELKAKAFLIFEKKLYSYTFKTWELGNWMLQGKFEAAEDGTYAFTKTLSGFGKDGGLPTGKPQLEAKVVSPETFLNDRDGVISEKYMAYRIFHDIQDPTFGYSPQKQAALINQLKRRTDLHGADFNAAATGTLKASMDGLAARPNAGMMADGEWVAYSTTKGLVTKKDRKSVKGVDAKLAAYNAATTNPARIEALTGTLSDEEVNAQLATVNLEKGTADEDPKKAAIFRKAGLIQICDLYLIRNGNKNRAEMVAKLRMDAVAELERLKAL
jgi:hypothetical protein